MLRIILVSIALAVVSGPAVWGQPLAERDARYRIQAMDVLEIAFEFTPEFNQEARVQPDGFLPLKGAGDLKVAGLSLPEAADAVTARYRGTLRDPVVSLTLKEFTLPAVVVGGHVARPGRFELRGEMSVLDAVALAGGLQSGGKESEVLLFRRARRDEVEVRKVDLKHMLRAGDLSEDILLRDGDAIYVSRSVVGTIERFMAVSRLGLYFNPIPFLK